VLRAVVLVVVLLLLLFFGGGGWYFAGQIHEDGLKVDPWSPSYGQNVSAAGEGTITISDPADEQPILDGDAVWGIQWEGGYGQVSGPGSTADEVTRDFTVLSGEAPRPDEPIALDRAAFPLSDPAAAVGEGVSEISYTSPSGEVPAWYVPGEGTTWAVLVHGKGATRAETLRMMRSTVAAGLPSLAIGYRNDADAPPDPSGLYQFGRTEWQDLDGAIQYAQELGAEEVVVVGASMGAAITASYLHQVADAPVSAMILDAPMLDFGETVSHGAAQRSLPVLGTVPEPLTWTAKQIAAVRYDVDWRAVDYLEDTSWVDVPTLVVHGTEDATVPVGLSERLAAEKPDLVQLETFDGAGHVAAWNTDPARYDRLLEEFLSGL
jgi:hypothetical protein